MNLQLAGLAPASNQWLFLWISWVFGVLPYLLLASPLCVQLCLDEWTLFRPVPKEICRSLVHVFIYVKKLDLVSETCRT